MSTTRGDETPQTHDSGADEEADRKAILARREALVRRVVTSVGAVALGVMGVDCAPQACLRPVTDAQVEASAQPCLGARPDDAEAPADASADAQDDAQGNADASPMPCLDIAPEDAGRSRD